MAEQPSYLHKAEVASFRQLHENNLKTSRARQLKETFSDFWDYQYAGAVERCFKEWYAKAIRSQLEPVNAAARMLKTHLPELLNYLVHRITNATSEGFNSLIQNIKANARGSPNSVNFRIRIRFYCSKLDMIWA